MENSIRGVFARRRFFAAHEKENADDEFVPLLPDLRGAAVFLRYVTDAPYPVTVVRLVLLCGDELCPFLPRRARPAGYAKKPPGYDSARVICAQRGAAYGKNHTKYKNIAMIVVQSGPEGARGLRPASLADTRKKRSRL